jgi:hypothetical protein
MKTHSGVSLLIAVLLAFAARLVHGQGTLVIQHSGATDPTTEGFTLGSSNPVQVGGVINDLGFNAWSTAVSYSSVGYYCSIENLTGLDWELTGTLRIVSSNPVVFNLNLTTGSEYYNLRFGSKANGDPQVVVVGSSTSPVFTLNNAGSTYNTYQLLYDAASDTADLYINGAEQLENIAGGTYSEFPLSPSLGFGGGNQGPTSQANWNMVSLEIVPEPSAISLLFLGGGFLIYVRKRSKKRSAA